MRVAHHVGSGDYGLFRDLGQGWFESYTGLDWTELTVVVCSRGYVAWSWVMKAQHTHTCLTGQTHTPVLSSKQTISRHLFARAPLTTECLRQHTHLWHHVTFLEQKKEFGHIQRRQIPPDSLHECQLPIWTDRCYDIDARNVYVPHKSNHKHRRVDCHCICSLESSHRIRALQWMLMADHGR